MAVLLLLLLRQTFFQRWRQIESYSALDVFNITQIFLIVLATGHLLLEEARLRATLRQLKGTGVFSVLVYYVFACTSALWSAHPVYSLYMAGETVVLLLLTLVLFSHCLDFYRAERLAVGLTVLSIAFEMGTLIYRNWSQLSLEWLHTNTYSCSAAMLLVYGVGESFARRRQPRAPVRVALAVGGICLLAGTSTGSNIACFVALGLLIVWGKTLGVKQLMLAGFLGLLGVGVVAMEQTQWAQVLLGGKSVTGISSGESRLWVWERALNISLQSSVLGYGFCVGPKEHLQLTNAHNSFLELALNTGIVGLGIFSFALGQLVLELRRARNAERLGAQGSAAAFLAVTVNSLSVSVLAFSWTPPGLAFYAFLAFFSLYCRPGSFGPALPRAAAPMPQRHGSRVLPGQRAKRPFPVH